MHGPDVARAGELDRLVHLRVRVDARRFRSWVLGTAVVLSALSLPAHLPHGSTNLLRVLSADSEQSLPTLWSIVQLLLLAGLAGLAWRRAMTDRRAWGLAALGVQVMAIDEAVSIHEFLVEPLRSVLDPGREHPLLTFAWVLPGALVVLVVTAVALGFLRRMEPVLRRDLAVAAVVFVTGALGLEAVSGTQFQETGTSAAYVLLMGAEEFCEMVGVALACCALLRYLGRAQRAGLEDSERWRGATRHATTPTSTALDS